MKTNYHTHTTRCKHASGTDEAYVQAALRAGFDILGFADHTPWPYESGYISPIRMELSDLSDYVMSLRGLREKYAGSIQLLLGLECEYFPRYTAWLQEAKEAYGLDYLIFGAHYLDSDEENPYVGYICVDDAMVQKYTDLCVRGMESGLYAYLAHPDLYMRRRVKWDAQSKAAAKTICACALACGIPLELNLNAHVLNKDGTSGFPRREFWECAAETGNQVILGYDAHQPSLLENEQAAQECLAFMQKLTLQPIKSLALQKTKPPVAASDKEATL